MQKYSEVAQRALASSAKVDVAVESASGYEGQFRPQVAGIAGGAALDLRAYSDHIAELAHNVRLVADGFEAAEAAELAGFSGLAASLLATVDAGYDVSALPQWMMRRGRPPWVRPAVWEFMSAEERADYSRMIENSWGRFVSGDLSFTHATQTDTWNAFEVYMFLDGVTSMPPPYEVWGSAAAAAGLSLEDYVMDVLNITPYERDTVAGVGLIETRQVGPLATLLVGQTYYNRLFDDNWGDLDSAKSMFAGGSLNGVYFGRDWEGYTQAALALGDDPNIFMFKGGMQGSPREGYFRDLISLRSAAEAAQDGSWRLIAGYRLAEAHGVDGVTFFLEDPNSDWWEYHQELMDNHYVAYGQLDDYGETYLKEFEEYLKQSGASGETLATMVDDRRSAAVFPEFTDPSSLEGSLELIEQSYERGNVYEANPSYTKFEENNITDISYGFESEVEAKLEQIRGELLASDEYKIDLTQSEDRELLQQLLDDRRGELKLVMPRYMYEAYMDGKEAQGQPYWNSLVMLQNTNTGTGFVSFYTPDATEFFPSH
ncbi:MAG: hypothetical protein ACC700_10930 [Anaerolineales bacterium]